MSITRKNLIKLPVVEITQHTISFPLRKKLSVAMDTLAKNYIVCARTPDSSSFMYLTEIDPITGTAGLLHTYLSRAIVFKTATEAREAALKWISEKDLRKRSHKIEIVGEFNRYEVKYPAAKETYDEKVAFSWYKNYRIHTSYNSETCYWIEGGDGYVDIYLYHYDRNTGKITPMTTYNRCDTSKVTDYIVRLSAKSGYIGIVKINEKGRKEIAPGSWSLDYYENNNKCDLRNIKLNDSTFSVETMKVLKESGFPSVRWSNSWGFNESPSRINNYGALMRMKNPSYYSRNNTQRSSEINDFCKNIPFDEEHCVVPFKNGYIARFGKIIQAWQSIPYSYRRRGASDEERDVNPYDMENAEPIETCSVTNSPTYYTKKDGTKVIVSKLVEEKFVESVRIWISNTFSIRSVCISKAGGTTWEPTRIDLCDNRWSDGSNFAPGNPLYTECGIDLEQFNKKVYEKLFKSHPRLKYLIGYTDLHPTLYKGDDIKFLRALFDYQKVVETFISLGLDHYFWRESNRESGKEQFNFNRFIEQMKLNEIPHKSSSDFYQILGLNKAQFKLIFKNPKLEYYHIMDILYRISWDHLIPGFPTDGWRAEDHKSRASYPLIPVQYIETLIKIYEDQLEHNHTESYTLGNTINNYIGYGFDLKAIYKYMCIKRVDNNMYLDYLRMRSELERNSTTSHFDPHLWDKKLDDADDVHFTHDRMVFVYNQWSAECARYRCLGDAEKEKKRQKLYDERYKTLKSFNYHEKEDNRSIVVPEKLMEIVVEGQVLHHCVGSFVESVSEGRDTIVFLRNKAMPDVPYATVSLLYDTVAKEWYIDQAHTAYNGDITEEDVLFLKRWGLKHKVRQSSIRKQYGARCHH